MISKNPLRFVLRSYLMAFDLFFLQTYKKDDSDGLLFDVHFWIGKYSTQASVLSTFHVNFYYDSFTHNSNGNLCH